MKLYMVRHGETEFNKRHCYYGVTDAELNEVGIEQARILGRYFQDIHLDAVIASPLRRARDTAEYICNTKEVEIRTDDLLMEQNFGIFEGMSAGKIVERYPEVWERWNQNFSDYRLDGGESFRDVRKRIDSFLEDKLQGEKGNVLIVAHKGTLGHMLASLLHMPLDSYWNFVFDQGCVNVIDLEDGYAIIRGLNIPVI